MIKAVLQVMLSSVFKEILKDGEEADDRQGCCRNMRKMVTYI